MYTEIKEALIDAGFAEDSARRIAEILNDYGWDSIRDVLNSL